MFVNDFECSKCGVISEIMTNSRVDQAECPECGGVASKIFTKAPDYHMSIDTFMEHQRGHLGPKIKKSMEKEARLKQEVERARRTVRGGQ